MEKPLFFPAPEKSPEQLHLKCPFLRVRKLREMLNKDAFDVGRKHVVTLMRKDGRQKTRARLAAPDIISAWPFDRNRNSVRYGIESAWVAGSRTSPLMPDLGVDGEQRAELRQLSMQFGKHPRVFRDPPLVPPRQRIDICAWLVCFDSD